MIRTHRELTRLKSFEERFEYLKLRGQVGKSTFGYDRSINQAFYRSSEWRRVRNLVIARDEGLDLGVTGYEIFDRPIIHHMNPMGLEDLVSGDDDILNPEYLVCVSHRTHNAIHYGAESLLPKPLVDLRPGDTSLL